MLISGRDSGGRHCGGLKYVRARVRHQVRQGCLLQIVGSYRQMPTIRSLATQYGRPDPVCSQYGRAEWRPAEGRRSAGLDGPGTVRPRSIWNTGVAW